MLLRNVRFNSIFRSIIIYSALVLNVSVVKAQNINELNTGWRCAPVNSVKVSGEQLSSVTYHTDDWLPATVPGTVLTTLLNNKKVPDPFYGMNNERIPDIYKAGRDYYTYWFVKDFQQNKLAGGEQVYLNFRGVNYSFDAYLNGKKINKEHAKGMFMRFSYNITAYLSKTGKNRLAVIVHPPDVVGNPNGGQGGDGTIAKGVGLQYTAGWDWIQPMRDRNTGIWDKVTIERTGAVHITDPHIVTLVPGVRTSEGPQANAIIKTDAQLTNANTLSTSGKLSFTMAGKTVTKLVTIGAGQTISVSLMDIVLQNPKLWWPNGYGKQDMYDASMSFEINGRLSDVQHFKIGVREIQTTWNEHTGSRQIAVNGQKIFIKGGNWVISDAMLRLSDMRYDAEVRFHRDMNLNLIRVWGGAMIERPEFYAACDKYGLLVFQDFWGSGDCNGRWLDPMKADDQWTRRKYPDDHTLYLKSAADQIKMIRNYASLAIWCGGNEITPPEDILTGLRDNLLPKLDNTRWFVDYSNSESMSRNTLGGNGDGPYGIQPLSVFWQHRTFPFNSEVGSVGVGDYESLKRFIPAKNMVPPVYNESTRSNKVDSVWDYHKYIGYDTSINKYGKAKDAQDFARKAQLVNYDQYRGLAEGFSSHMWDWYTGFIIWKTQNPWTAMRGQMYDYYLDPNACLYGLHNGSEPLHVMCNPVTGMVSLVNNTFTARRSIMLVVKATDMGGKDSLITQVFVDIVPSSTKNILSVKEMMDKLAAKEGAFLTLQLFDTDKRILSENIYWLPDSKGEYSGLQHMQKDKLDVAARKLDNDRIEVTLTNKPGSVPSFFNRISLNDKQTGNRVLPTFYSDNYITVMPGQTRKIIVESKSAATKSMAVEIDGWNSADGAKQINILN
ncbi:glycoside hydrolase family 2 protein [Mucilaginibacter sp.]|uniref:glycoside hydrolase family 2 protein n=1 Tax=Mucilaginibacter sp. TaxID=1882438 RepID=UPI000CB0AF3F|nr:glycoside hydrolase family 2 TIM barrel-domain containing protein [Mucilaginibacter sp.]PLW89729.1 MAG: glycosyl hydrolase [Mucilaginibacter sp.]PMP66004.1 MAG: glycosyl hydrolase [Mucilaginibacter sp.]HEK22341.1 glycosyl hydrolase [Bacteroidota bacterium]